MKYASLKYNNTTNLGDQIQSFAAEQYLPSIDRRFDRDSLASASADGKHLLIMNGWFSHRPLACFPPSDTIVPVFVGFHIADAPETQAHFLGPAAIAYLRQHGPIGCRDKRTMEMLSEKGVDAYYSKCLTLTFPPRDPGPRRDKIAIVDADQIAVPKTIRQNAVPLTHIVSGEHNDEVKRAMARRLLDFYRDEACLVITTRLHCALPCIAMQVPVVFFGDPQDYRLSILDDLGVPLHDFKPRGFVSKLFGNIGRANNDIDWNPAPVPVKAEQHRISENVRRLIAQRIGAPASPAAS